MAKAASRTVKAADKADPQVQRDQELVQEAYEAAVRRHVDDFIVNCIDGTAGSDQKFCSGLTTIRKARLRALELVAG
jgi:hypothetical protein